VCVAEKRRLVMAAIQRDDPSPFRMHVAVFSSDQRRAGDFVVSAPSSVTQAPLLL